MPEILFRGKRIDNGEWVEGFYNRTWLTNGEVITEIREFERPHHMQYFIEVDPSTVGQYTGLTDKNGKRIFEGDVVEHREYGNLAVVWDDGAFQLMREDTFYDMLDHYTLGFAVFIGNIHDNPELLEEVSDNGN